MSRTVVDVLMEARDLLDSPDRWVKKALYGFGRDGQEAHCARGAVLHATGMCSFDLNVDGESCGLADKGFMYLDKAAQTKGWTSAVALNDGAETTLEDVREMFDEAIRLAKEEQDG